MTSYCSILHLNVPEKCRVSLKTDRTSAQQTAQLEGDDNVHARLLDSVDDRTATLQKSFCIPFQLCGLLCGRAVCF